MSIIRNIYFRDEIADWLKDQPKVVLSKLINDLLTDYIRKHILKELTLEELKALKEKEKARIEYEAKLREIDDGYKLG